MYRVQFKYKIPQYGIEGKQNGVRAEFNGLLYSVIRPGAINTSLS